MKNLRHANRFLPFLHHPTFLFLLILFSSLQTIVSYIEKETYQTQTQTGDWSEPITAVHEQWTDPAQHFLCGYAVRQMKWRKLLYNCNCGNRMETIGVVAYKCDWCENTFWTMRNGFKAIFCSINNWQSQITKIHETGNIESRNWKEYKCPKGFYVKQTAGRLGIEQQTVLGFTGMQMVCSNLEQTQTIKVEDPSKICLEEPSDNSPGTFVSAVQVKSEKLGKITGLKWIFEGIAYIKQAEVIKFGEIIGKSTQKMIEMVTLPTAEVLKKMRVPLSTTLTTSGLWLLNKKYYYGFRVGEFYLKPPQYQMEKDEGLYRATQSKVNFNTTSTTVYAPISPVYATINPFVNVTAKTVFPKLQANVTYTMKVRFYDRTTEEFIVEKIIQGTYSGVVEAPISIAFEQKKMHWGLGKKQFYSEWRL